MNLGNGLKIDNRVYLGYCKIKEPRICDIDRELVIGDDVIIRHGTIIYTSCKINSGTMIGHHTVIREATTIGSYCKIGHLVVIEGAVVIGDHTSIYSQCHITAYSDIGSYVFIAPMVVTTNDWIMDYERKNIRDNNKYKGVTIHDGARIGAGCVIFPGITIGREAKIGAGSLVTKDIPDYRIAYGSPISMGGFVPDDERLKNNGIEI